MNYYIADPHFSHGNIIKHDRRPFETVDEKDREITAQEYAGGEPEPWQTERS